MLTSSRAALLGAALLAFPSIGAAQNGAMIYRLGRDTVAIETWTRTAKSMTGEMVVRTGPAVQRLSYEFTLGPSGRPVAAVMRRRQADGTPFPNAPTEWRMTIRGDSAIRTTVFADSAPVRAFAIANAFPNMPVFVYGPLELLYSPKRTATQRDSFPALAFGGNPGFLGFEPVSGDTLRLRGSVYPMLLRFDKQGRLLSVDGSLTTNKAIGTRESAALDLATIAKGMKPSGVLSPRQTAYAGFNQGPILINYGSPSVRGRTVWGGTLVPFDSVWRLGANEATHLATSKTIQLGDMTLAPGLYTLWLQHTRTGTFLIVNRQVGQWGTVYDPAQDIGRVPVEMKDLAQHQEDLLITIRPAGPGRGVIDIAWGDRLATASFTVK